jgi:hypothetical protein
VLLGEWFVYKGDPVGYIATLVDRGALDVVVECGSVSVEWKSPGRISLGGRQKL